MQQMASKFPELPFKIANYYKASYKTSKAQVTPKTIKESTSIPRILKTGVHPIYKILALNFSGNRCSTHPGRKTQEEKVDKEHR